MIVYTLYQTANGRVVSFGHVKNASSLDGFAGAGEAIYQGEDLDGREWYLPGGVKTARPTLSFDTTSIIADDTDIATLAGLPDPCTVYVDGEAQEVTGGTMEFSADVAGDYEIEVRDANAFPARAFKATVTAT